MYETGLDSVGQPYLLLQYLPGGSLADRLHRRPLPVPDVLDIAATVTGVLVAAHDQDPSLRPQARQRAVRRQQARSPDFESLGRPPLPTAAIDNIYAGSCGAGTVGRQASGVSTDLYALGSMLHQLLVGRAPFRTRPVRGYRRYR